MNMNNLHPPGRMTALMKYGRVVITNAMASVCLTNESAAPRVFALRTDEEGFDGSPDLMWMDLSAMGLSALGRHQEVYRKGKFVCFRDGMFLLAPDQVPHWEMPALVGRRPQAVMGAGFIQAYPPDRLELTGMSESLNRLGPRLDYRDWNAIAQHLQLQVEERSLETRMMEEE